ncbi:MAG: carbohydrate ABC transporter permease [Acidobacteria bacterium]|nr:carbohydrate ABC transporter permease [Acidobacteriota bacterium]
MRIRERHLKILRAVTVAITAVIILLPVVWFILIGVINYDAVLRGSPRLADFTLEHYRKLSARVPVSGIILDTAFLALLSSIFAALLAVPSAYVISRGDGKLFNQLYTISLTVWLVPPVALSLQVYFWFIQLGLYDEFGGLLVLYSVIGTTLIILLLTPFLDRIPKQLDEAAWVDGLQGFGALWHIHLPAVSHLLLGASMLCFVRSWNELLFAGLLTNVRVRTMPVAILSMVTGSHIEWGQIAALGTLALIPAPLALAFFLASGVFKQGRRRASRGGVSR